MLIALTAASPTVLLSGHAPTCFAGTAVWCPITASMLALLDEKPFVGGLCAGLATISLSAGVALILAALITFGAHRRLRSFGRDLHVHRDGAGGAFARLAGRSRTVAFQWPIAPQRVWCALWKEHHVARGGAFHATQRLCEPLSRAADGCGFVDRAGPAAAVYSGSVLWVLLCCVAVFRTEPPLYGFVPVLPML